MDAVNGETLKKAAKAPRKTVPKASAQKGRNGDLKQGHERLLWGRAGGRCQRCNADVSRDTVGWRAYNLAENVDYPRSDRHPRLMARQMSTRSGQVAPFNGFGSLTGACRIKSEASLD